MQANGADADNNRICKFAGRKCAILTVERWIFSISCEGENSGKSQISNVALSRAGKVFQEP